ncbi:hypothetical protein ABXV15_03530 [Exiguobacterium profundum]|uniref:hypothetical protein n=1 Tax=Exiguobacterium profundum TaxID=307643 RepID=UPI0033932AF2
MIKLIIKSKDLQNIINNLLCRNSEEQFLDLLEYMNKKQVKIVLIENEDLDNLYTNLYTEKAYKKHSDIVFINLMLEKLTITISENNFNDLIRDMNRYVYTDEFTNIFSSSTTFNSVINYGLYENTINQNYFLIKNIKEYLQLGCITSMNSSNPEELIDNMKLYTQNLVFDPNIVDHLYKLSAPFSVRLKQIIHHLYVIETEIPCLISQGLRSYDQIGKALSVSCSPERNRDTVQKHLTATLNSKALNCELHTKLQRVSSNPPDRIYFCPSIPDTICKNSAGKSYIYKITAHV